jgi:hypothetical protein
VLNTSGVTVTTHGANGANIANYDWLLDAQGVVLGNNYEPNAHIVAPRRSLAGQAEGGDPPTPARSTPPHGTSS